MIVNGTFEKGRAKRTSLNPILQTRHSWNAVPVQNNSRCGAVDLWSTYANLQTRVQWHIVHTSTKKKLFNITPLGARKPKRPPQEPGSHGSESFSRHNCFNLCIISDLVITYNAQYTIGAILVYLGQLLLLCVCLDGGDNGPWHRYRPFCGALWLWLPPNTAWNDRSYLLPLR